MTDEHATQDPNASTEGWRDVLVVGGGVAGLTAATFTARAGFDTLVANHGESILCRNAHLENFPGFPAGVNPRLFADMLEAQASRNGADIRRGEIVDVRRDDDGFVAEAVPEDDRSGFGEESSAGGSGTPVGSSGPPAGSASSDAGDVSDIGGDPDADGPPSADVRAERIVAASWSDASYLDGLGVEIRDAGHKRYVGDDDRGRTDVEGAYVAGRLAERYHQAIVAAGHGAQAAITLIHDSDAPFFNDWVTPEGYFTDRGREVPPGCEEISETERRARERESMAAMRAYFDDPHEDRQRTHPSLVEDELGRVPEEEEEE